MISKIPRVTKSVGDDSTLIMLLYIPFKLSASTACGDVSTSDAYSSPPYVTLTTPSA